MGTARKALLRPLRGVVECSGPRKLLKEWQPFEKNEVLLGFRKSSSLEQTLALSTHAILTRNTAARCHGKIGLILKNITVFPASIFDSVYMRIDIDVLWVLGVIRLSLPKCTIR